MPGKSSLIVLLCCGFLCSALLSGCAVSEQARMAQMAQVQTAAMKGMVSELTVSDNPAMDGLPGPNASAGQLVAMASSLVTASSPGSGLFLEDDPGWFLQESLHNIEECPHCAAIGNIVTSEYGNRQDPTRRGVRFHAGVDISVPQGSGIMAFKGGIVTKATRHATYGLVVEILQYDGYLARYAHMSKILAERGDVLRGGELIGEVGRTGRATGPHLHFELIHEGESLDPMLFLTRVEQVVRCKHLDLAAS